MGNNRSNLHEITFRDLWQIFISRLWAIVLVVVIAVTSTVVFNKLTYTPKYESTATLYILKQTNEKATQTSDSDDFSLALKVVNDCDHLLKSHGVLDEVIDKLNLDISYDELYDSVSTSNPEDTRILEVTVEATDPQSAKKIVDKICDVGVKKITAAMGFKQVNLYEYGILETEPSNQTRLITYFMIGLIAGLIAYVVFLLVFLFDDRITTDDEIYKSLKLQVIGDIPNAYENKNHKYGYYKYYGVKNDDNDKEED